MRRTRKVLISIGAAMAVCQLMPSARAAPSPAPPGRTGDGAGYAAHRVLVGVTDGARSVRNAIDGLGGRIVERQPAGDLLVVHVPAAPEAWAATFRSTPGVRYAEPDFLVREDDTVPNDPSWPSLWGLQAIHAPAAWDTSTGSSSVIVGVIDSGIDLSHPDLAGRLWTNPGEIPGNGIDDDHDGWVDDVHGADCARNDGDPIDDDGHGTHVAGTIGAAGNDGVGVVGVNWNVRLLALDIFRPNGTAAVSDIAQCIDYAIAHGVRVTNDSWGGAAFSQAEYDAFVRAKNAGILMVAAAGNTGWDVDTTPLYPAAFDLDNVLSVAASQQDDSLAAWSCHGATSVDIAAPGVDILSTWPTYLYAPGYWQMSGTSMAAPHVTGVAALILSIVPGATYPLLRDAILSSAKPVASLAGEVSSGGRLDAAAALTAAGAPPSVTATAPVPSLRGATTVASTSAAVDLRWSASDTAGITSYELQRSTDGGATYVNISLKPAATTWRQKAMADAPSYSFRVRATDEHGAMSPWATELTFRLRYVQESAPSIAYVGAWSNSSVSGALGGGVRVASAAGATATVSLGTGTQAFGLVFARTPSSGKAEIWLDGSRRATLDLYRSALQARWVGFAASLDASAMHSIVIKVLGQRRAASAGTAVLVDAIATLAT